MAKLNTIQNLLDSFLKTKNEEKTEFWDGYMENSNKGQNEAVEFTRELSKIIFSVEENKTAIKKTEKDNDYQKLIKEIEKDELFEQAIFKHKPVLNLFLKIAAVILPVFISISTYLFIQNKQLKETSEEILSTPKGARSKIHLEDGTIVWLNAESELKYPSTFKGKKERIVYLTGEAYFDVKKNNKQNFIVYTSDFKIDVLGTSFNVCSYPDDYKIETTLEEGVINIQRIDEQGNLKGQNILLKPNQSITLFKDLCTTTTNNNIEERKKKNNEEHQVSKEIPLQQILVKENIDTKPYTSWKDSQLIFKSMSLNALIPKLERWYDVNITVDEENLKNIAFTGTFEKETLEQAIEALCKASHLNFKIDKDTVLLMSK